MRALCKVKPRNWQAAFEDGTCTTCCKTNSAPTCSGGMYNSLQNYLDSARELRNIMPAHIGNLWHLRKSKALKAMRSKTPCPSKPGLAKQPHLVGCAKSGRIVQKTHPPAYGNAARLAGHPTGRLGRGAKLQFDVRFGVGRRSAQHPQGGSATTSSNWPKASWFLETPNRT